MKTILFLIITIISFSLFSQTERGVSPVEQSTINNQQSPTRAVVVGISDYQDEGIPDLRFADKDAEAFAAYLQSPAGGAVPANQIILLLNEKATNARIADALIWMLEESQPGDQAIIYFSGHGDVETITRFNRGYLLTYDSPPKIYMAGAFNIRDLQDIISTMSDSDVQVVMISDACRAGKLAGAEVGGTQATAQNLSQQFANEVKILSCQPNEFSLEGEQWGGGRGAFSYHLLDGLHGLADKNGDALVNLFEIGRYLEDRVPEETAPHNQMPFTVGDRNAQVAKVDAASLMQLQELKANEQQLLSKIETKGMEELLLIKVDSNIQEMYASFVAALDNKQLLEPIGKSAYDLYQMLSQKEEIKDLHNIMRRNLSVALQEGAQQAVNAYLAANPDELTRRYEAEEDYSLYPRYLEKAVELLGEQHFYYKNLMAKRLYFEGLGLRLSGAKEAKAVRDSIYKTALEKQFRALEYQERAPYVLNELGALHILLKQDSTALGYLDQAIETSPDWGLPYVNYSVGLFYLDDIDKAIEYGEKAAERMPDFPRVYSFLAWISVNNWQYSDKKNMRRRGIELQDDFFYEVDDMNWIEQKKVRYSKAIELLRKAVEVDSVYAFAYSNLGLIYSTLDLPDEAIQYHLKAVKIDPDNPQYVGRLALAYTRSRRLKEAEQAYLKAIDLNPGNRSVYNNLAIVYRELGDADKTIEMGKKALEIEDFWQAHSKVAWGYEMKGQLKQAEISRIKMVKSSNDYPDALRIFGDFYNKIYRYKDAEWAFKKALSIKPDYFEAMNRLIDIYFKTNQYEKAEVLAEKLIEGSQDELITSMSLEIINFHKGNFEKAAEYSKKVDELNQQESSNLSNLAYRYLYANHFERAAKYFDKAEIADPTIIWNYWNWCCYFSIKGEPKKAIQALETALKKGFSNFNHIHTDPDAANMRNEPEFEMLMEKYFPGQVYEGKPAPAQNTEPIYFPENCLLLADFYESEGEHERAKFLRERAEELDNDE